MSSFSDENDNSESEDEVFHLEDDNNNDVANEDEMEWEDINDDDPDDPGEASAGDPIVVDDNNEAPKSKNTKTKPKLVWNETELFPVSNSTSFVWKHCGFQKVEGKLDKTHTICSHCGNKLKYLNSPASMSNHLLHVHKITAEEPAPNKQPKITAFACPNKSSVTKYKPNNPKQKAFSQAIIKWLVKSKRPLNVLKDEELVESVFIADPCLSLPNYRAARKSINALYEKKLKYFKNLFKEELFFSCTTDAGTSLSNHTFIDINVHWIDANFKIHKKIISVKHAESKKAVDYRKIVDDALRQHGILHKCHIFTTDNENTMKACFEALIRNGCIAHIQSKASQKSLESSEKLKKLRKKLRKVAKKANKSPKFKLEITKQQKSNSVKQITLKQEIATRFTATHTMFHSFLNDPNHKTEDDMDREAVDKNIRAINCAMDSTLATSERDKLKIVEEDVNVMATLMPTLDILEEGVALLGGEKYSTGSVVLPFLNTYLEVLEGDEDDQIYFRKFKDTLKNELITRCYDNLNFKMLLKSSFFDMRYTKMNFLSNLNKYELTDLTYKDIFDEISDELEAITVENELVAANVVEESPQPPKKKKRRFLIDDGADNVQVVGSAIEQLKMFAKESAIRPKEDTLDWWRLNQAKYPDLAKLARKYLCIQGSSTAAERVMSTMGIILNKKRLSMTDENFSEMMYLSDCI